MTIVHNRQNSTDFSKVNKDNFNFHIRNLTETDIAGICTMPVFNLSTDNSNKNNKLFKSKFV